MQIRLEWICTLLSAVLPYKNFKCVVCRQPITLFSSEPMFKEQECRECRNIRRDCQRLDRFRYSSYVKNNAE